MKVVVIYHAHCDDGVAAAWCAWKYFSKKPNYEVEYLPASYGDAPPDVTGKMVYILDFSYDRRTVEEMTEKSHTLYLLDHHKSALEKWSSYPEELTPNDNWVYYFPHGRIEFDMQRSGARMAWDYFFPGQEVPSLIQHVEDNDLWRFQCANTKQFIRALRSYPQTIESMEMIHNLVEDDIDYDKFVEEGEAIERYFQQQCQFILDNATPVEVRLGEVVGLGINAPRTFASELGNILADRSGTFGLVYFIDALVVHVSLRSKGDYDVSKLAQQYGGGGHRNAAGCDIELDRFIYEIWSDIS